MTRRRRARGRTRGSCWSAASRRRSTRRARAGRRAGHRRTRSIFTGQRPAEEIPAYLDAATRARVAAIDRARTRRSRSTSTCDRAGRSSPPICGRTRRCSSDETAFLAEPHARGVCARRFSRRSTIRPRAAAIGARARDAGRDASTATRRSSRRRGTPCGLLVAHARAQAPEASRDGRPSRAATDAATTATRTTPIRDVAEGFDALRFSGPIGRLSAREPGSAAARGARAGRRPARSRRRHGHGPRGDRPGAGRRDRHGRRRVGRDARRGRARAQRGAASTSTFGVGDAHALPLADRSVDAAVCLRVLMHAIDWRQCVAELCRVVALARRRRFSGARRASPRSRAAARRLAQRAGRADRGVSRDGRARRDARVRGARLSRRHRPPPVRAADRAAQGRRVAWR